jgi:hypothetical protein
LIEEPDDLPWSRRFGPAGEVGVHLGPRGRLQHPRA